MDNEISGGIRPCMFLAGGEYVPGLFHRWVLLVEDHFYLKQGATVALIENRYGTMIYIKPQDMYFTDSKEQMAKIGLCVGSDGLE